MMRKSRLFCMVVSVLVITLYLSACGGGGESSTDNTPTGNTPAGSTDSTPTGNTPTGSTDSTPPPTDLASTALIDGYMVNARQIEDTAYTNDLIILNRQLASQGLSGSGSAVVQIKDLKLSHISNFVSVSLQYVSTIKNSQPINKQAVEQIFNTNKTHDINDITSVVTSAYNARGINVNSTVLTSATTGVTNTYTSAIYQIDAM
jgi:hypothetical protein